MVPGVFGLSAALPQPAHWSSKTRSGDVGWCDDSPARIISRVHSDELVGLHRLVIAESGRFPELARVLHSYRDARHIARLAEHIRVERGEQYEALAEPLFSLLLGERHRRRLLGLTPPPTPRQAAPPTPAGLWPPSASPAAARLCFTRLA